MTKSLRGGAQPGGRKREFIRAGTASYSCSISSRPTRDATSISWRVPLPSLNPRSIEDPSPCRGENEVQAYFSLLERRLMQRGDVLLQRRASECRRGRDFPPSTTVQR